VETVLRYDQFVTTDIQHNAAPEPITAADDDDGFGFETAPAEPAEPVSPLIAVIRIVSVLAMGLLISFGLFISLVGWKGLLVGIPCLIAAIPCFYGMQFAEKLAQKQAAQVPPEADAT
jgi:hypothetical protein